MTTATQPRVAATILVVRDDPFEVLMIARHADQDFSSALVFPGGLVDASDADDAWLPYISDTEGLAAEARALRIAAFRETYEECGLLLARRRDGTLFDGPVPSAAADFRELVERCDVVLPLQDLVHYAHWITPDIVPRRYDTHFFLAKAPAGQVACCDGKEAVDATWVQPQAALAQAASGARKIIFPTRMNLGMLAQSSDVNGALAASRARTVHTVRPRVEKRETGTFMVIPEGVGYSETEEVRADL